MFFPACWVLSRFSGFQLGFLNYLLNVFCLFSMWPCCTLVTWGSCRQPECLSAVPWMDIIYWKLVIMDQTLWQWISLFSANFTDLNSQYYLLIRRQLMFEIAETYNEMADLKLSRANRHGDTQSLDNHTIKKINHLCSSSAKWVLSSSVWGKKPCPCFTSPHSAVSFAPQIFPDVLGLSVLSWR